MKSFPAKLLLFGEHTVNLGSEALAMPLPLFSGQWVFEKNLLPQTLVAKQMGLPQFAAYLAGLRQSGDLFLPFDTPAFQDALTRGLVFQSNIPTGYGAGSSGALVAAAYDKFGGQEPENSLQPSENGSPLTCRRLEQLKIGFAQMESFFHGASSGTDPLICFLKKPVLLGGPAGVRIVSLPAHSPANDDWQIFLLDTGISRYATPMIEYFLEKSREPGFRQLCDKALLPAVNEAITAFLNREKEALFDCFHRIGEFQLQHLERMIPAAFRPVWQQGLAGDHFKLKVCGAGGGGFILGITKDFAAMESVMRGCKLAAVLSV
jgi:mevalonate kinase